MKKALVVLLVMLVSAGMFADFTWMQLNLYEGIGVSQPFAGETYNLTYFELEGGGRTGILNLYYFVDVNHIFGVRDELNEGNSPGNYFMKINPRFSLTKLMNKESCFGPIKESYLATQYKGWNGGDNYYVGLGTDLAIPMVDMFSFNFYKMFQHIDGPNDDGDIESTMEDAGWVLAINWFTNLKKFSDDFNLTYQGWSDFGLANTYAEDWGGVATEWQMFNGFFWNYKKWSLSTSVKLHNNFLYFDGETHDAISPWVGLHRRF
jgi:nucleoside-specific channel-forming protein